MSNVKKFLKSCLRYTTLRLSTLRFTIWDLGFTIWDLRFGIYDLGVGFLLFTYALCLLPRLNQVPQNIIWYWSNNFQWIFSNRMR